MSAFHDLTLLGLDGQDLPLSPFKGKVLLVVNVASKCGLTPQYAGLENLYQTYRERGFAVLGVPCNQFAGQEPGSEADIQSFCSLNYGVSFPMSAKVEVNGSARHPLYRLLAGEGAEFPGDITWNFEKFLLGPRRSRAGAFQPAHGAGRPGPGASHREGPGLISRGTRSRPAASFPVLRRFMTQRDKPLPVTPDHRR